MNCQRTRSLLSAFLDGELTGEEMLLVRQHVFSCEDCHEEFSSLQVVKRLLGSLESVNAENHWSSALSHEVYFETQPWWERRAQSDSSRLIFESVSAEQGMNPRGRRMVRVLALSAVVVFLAASPFSRHDRPVTEVTGNMAASMGMPMPFFSMHPAAASFSNSPFQDIDRAADIQPTYAFSSSSDVRQVSDVMRSWSMPSAGPNELTLTVSGSR